jgi:hypothetical protein
MDTREDSLGQIRRYPSVIPTISAAVANVLHTLIVKKHLSIQMNPQGCLLRCLTHDSFGQKRGILRYLDVNATLPSVQDGNGGCMTGWILCVNRMVQGHDVIMIGDPFNEPMIVVFNNETCRYVGFVP